MTLPADRRPAPAAIRAAAVQLEPTIGDVPANLGAAERLVRAAAAEGAQWVALPEFFTTGMGFVPELAECALPPDGLATEMLTSLAAELQITLGGSFLCADDDGKVRNAFLLVDASGVLGRHDKDIPTMWENCFYVGGTTDGVISHPDVQVGAALCLEFNRYRTVRRLRGRVQLVIGGSAIWGLPVGLRDVEALRRRNDEMVDWLPRFARLMGVPVIEGNVTGRLDCQLPGFPAPVRYYGRLGRSAMIVDADGRVLAERGNDEGEGVVVADVEPSPLGSAPTGPVPDEFWIHGLDPLSAFGWAVQNRHGRSWYRRHEHHPYQPAPEPS